MKKWIIVCLLTLLPSLSFAETVTINTVVKATVFKIDGGRTIRLIGINAIEDLIFKNPSRRYERTVATDFVKSLGLEGKEARLEYGSSKSDNAYLYFKVCDGDCIADAKENEHFVQLDDGTYNFFNATLVKSGYAEPLPIGPNKQYAKLFQDLFGKSRRSKRGIWK